MGTKNLLLAFGFAALAAGALAAAVVTLSSDRRGAGAGDVAAYVGSAVLLYPPALARGDGRGGGVLEAVDLAAQFPQFSPPDPPRPGRPGAPLVFLTLRAQGAAMDPADRPVKLYARFLANEALGGPAGLQMRHFEAGSPYQREDLYIAPPEGREFAARCTQPAQPPDGIGETCLTDLLVKGLEVQLRYPPALLGEWEALQAGARKLVEGIVR